LGYESISPTAEASAHRIDATHLLWTGGWDSTFRLLQLLLVERVPVVPHYLRDPTRPSTDTELATIARITECVFAAYPRTRALLRPLRVAAVEDIPTDPSLSDALGAVRKQVYIGSQYAWLAAYCKQHRIGEMELSVHVDDKVHALLAPVSIAFHKRGGHRSIRIDPRTAGSPEHALFRFYSMPLFEHEKTRMGAEADARGWGPIMEMTWFCHSPAAGKPCGICGPCVYTIEEGLGRRVPRSRRALSFFYRHFARPVRSALRGALHGASRA